MIRPVSHKIINTVERWNREGTFGKRIYHFIGLGLPVIATPTSYFIYAGQVNQQPDLTDDQKNAAKAEQATSLITGEGLHIAKYYIAGESIGALLRLLKIGPPVMNPMAFDLLKMFAGSTLGSLIKYALEPIFINMLYPYLKRNFFTAEPKSMGNSGEAGLTMQSTSENNKMPGGWRGKFAKWMNKIDDNGKFEHFSFYYYGLKAPITHALIIFPILNKLKNNPQIDPNNLPIITNQIVTEKTSEALFSILNYFGLSAILISLLRYGYGKPLNKRTAKRLHIVAASVAISLYMAFIRPFVLNHFLKKKAKSLNNIESSPMQSQNLQSSEAVSQMLYTVGLTANA